MEDKVIPIFHPPEELGGREVGRVKVTQILGGCTIQAFIGEMQTTPKTISDRLPLFDYRVQLATRRAVNNANFQASLVYDQPSASDTLTV